MISVVNTHQSQLLYSSSKTGSKAPHNILITLPLATGILKSPLISVEERAVYRAITLGMCCNT